MTKNISALVICKLDNIDIVEQKIKSQFKNFNISYPKDYSKYHNNPIEFAIYEFCINCVNTDVLIVDTDRGWHSGKDLEFATRLGKPIIFLN